MGILQFRLFDLLDIAIVAFIIYQFLRFIKGTRATQMLIGLIFIFVIAFVANVWRLAGLTWIVNGLKTVWIVAFVIVFQPEIRRALSNLGRTRLVRFLLREEEPRTIDEIVKATKLLSERGVGGIIAVARRVGLKTYIETGVELDARVSAELLATIFTPYSPLHDGAVIIRAHNIVAAGCILPLSESPVLSPTVGTRHRAALGLSEETDAVCVVVSEETRGVSLALAGKLLRNLTPLKLREQLSTSLTRVHPGGDSDE